MNAFKVLQEALMTKFLYLDISNKVFYHLFMHIRAELLPFGNNPILKQTIS